MTNDAYGSSVDPRIAWGRHRGQDGRWKWFCEHIARHRHAHRHEHGFNEEDVAVFGDKRDGMGRGGRGFGQGFGRGRGHGDHHRGRPLEQGDLRWLALDLIAQQPRHGYEVIKAIEDAFNGHYAPSPGAVYPMLTLLEEMGFIASEAQGAKKLYSLTDAGRAEIEANAAAIRAARERLNDALARFGGAPAPELLRAMDNLRAALRVRLAKGELSASALTTITSALDRAASEVERS